MVVKAMPFFNKLTVAVVPTSVFCAVRTAKLVALRVEENG